MGNTAKDETMSEQPNTTAVIKMTRDVLTEWADSGERNGVTVTPYSDRTLISIGLMTVELTGEALDEFISGTENLMAETGANHALCELAHAAIVLVFRELSKHMGSH